MKHYIAILLIATMLCTSVAYGYEDNEMSTNDIIVSAVDMDDDGAISAVELAAALNSPALTDDEKNFVENASADGQIKAMATSSDSYPPCPAPPCGSYGDIDDNGIVTTWDSMYVLRHIVGNPEYPMTIDQMRRGDVDGDGVLTSADAYAMYMYRLGDIDTFPICALTDQQSMTWDVPGTYTVSVSAYNATTGQSEEVMWTITVIGDAPVITDWWNSKTNDNSTEFTVTVYETVEFGSTADQTIDRWDWT